MANEEIRAILHDYGDDLGRPTRERHLLDDETLNQLQRIGLQEATYKKRKKALDEANSKRAAEKRAKSVNSIKQALARAKEKESKENSVEASKKATTTPRKRTTRKKKTTE